MIKVHQMRVFNELMVAGSMSEAARNLHRTQPSISATISSLEADLGITLFERRKGRLLPVPEAEYLHKECGEILQRIETLGQNLQRIKAIDSGEISIACMPGPSVFFLPNLIAREVANRPNVRSVVASRSSDAIYRLLAAQRYDIGIADYDLIRSQETSLIETKLVQFDCLCAVPADDPLADLKQVTPRDLSGWPMGALYAEHPSFARTAQAFEETGVEFDARFQNQYFLPALTFVEQGLACAVVDPIAMESYQLHCEDRERIVFKPFAPRVLFEFVLITPAHRPASRLAQHFMDCICSELVRIGGRIVEES